MLRAVIPDTVLWNFHCTWQISLRASESVEPDLESLLAHNALGLDKSFEGSAFKTLLLWQRRIHLHGMDGNLYLCWKVFVKCSKQDKGLKVDPTCTKKKENLTSKSHEELPFCLSGIMETLFAAKQNKLLVCLCVIFCSLNPSNNVTKHSDRRRL